MRPIFETYSTPLFSSVIMPRIGDAVAAEDILRETLSSAIQKIHQFTLTDRSIFFWLRQIAINKTYDHHRRHQRGRKLERALQQEHASTQKYANAADHTLIEEEERVAHRKRIDETLSRLNERYQYAIRLQLIEERSREECAERLGVTVPTFDVVFFRATKAFRKHFGDRSNE